MNAAADLAAPSPPDADSDAHSGFDFGADSDAGDAATAPGARRWADALAAAALLAVDPGLGGVVVRARPGPPREAWLEGYRDLLAEGTPVRRLPVSISDDRLFGGLDLAATLAAGRPVAQSGLLGDADGGVIVAAMAERMRPNVVSALSAALDCGQAATAREGVSLATAARFALVALDEGATPDETLAPALADRLAFTLDLDAVALADMIAAPAWERADIAAARARLATVTGAEAVTAALCQAAEALGVASLRTAILAVRAARAAAALAGRADVTEEDARVAARLVLAPRATRAPAPPPDDAQADPPDSPEAPEPPEPPEPPGDDDAPQPNPETDPPEDPPADALTAEDLAEMLIASAQAALPADVLARLAGDLTAPPRGPMDAGGRAGAKRSGARGRPLSPRPGRLEGEARLALIDTLRAAAPWQRLRRPARGAGRDRLQIRAQDFRLKRFEARTPTTTIFVVDASGSAALARLAEAKGAVERLLAECYVRRDQAAVIAFRKHDAEMVLAPTRSLARAKKQLAGLPGGGGTPLAAGLDAAAALAAGEARRGRTPSLVIMTDGQANVGRGGKPGRAGAQADALDAARAIAALGVRAVLVDTSARPQAQARAIAEAMAARYLPLPYGNAEAVARFAQSSAPAGGGRS